MSDPIPQREESASSPSILCVDDETNILKSLKRLFQRESVPVLIAESGEEGLATLKEHPEIGLIMSDQRMPGMSGTAFLKEAAAICPDVPRMILTGYADMAAAVAAINEGGAYRFLAKPWNEQELLLAVRDGLQRYLLIQENIRLKKELEDWNANLKQRVLQQTAVIRSKLEETRNLNTVSRKTADALILMFADLMDQRHHRLSRHSRSVAALTEAITKTLDLPQGQRETFKTAALLHDIGLVCVSDKVLAKHPEGMSPEELTEYRAHSVKGQTALKVSSELDELGIIIRHHHEEFSGNGFPDGLAGDRIPLGSRIIHLASFIDHTYAPETGIDAKYQLTRLVNAAMGTRFDPALATAANLAVNEVLDNPRMQRITAEQEIPVKDLKIGMTLTRDIYSSRGILVVERGTAIDKDAFANLQRHSLNIPLGKVAYIQKSGAGK